jgi:hypothetical protein
VASKSELLEIIKKQKSVIDMLMPGVRHLAISAEQIALLNETGIFAEKAIREEKINREKEDEK